MVQSPVGCSNCSTVTMNLRLESGSDFTLGLFGWLRRKCGTASIRVKMVKMLLTVLCTESYKGSRLESTLN